MRRNLLQESKLTLQQASAEVPPARGRKTHVSTLLRWILHGVNGVKLEAVRLGGRWLTSREALQRFADQLTAKSVEPVTQFVVSARQAEVELELDRVLN